MVKPVSSLFETAPPPRSQTFSHTLRAAIRGNSIASLCLGDSYLLFSAPKALWDRGVYSFVAQADADLCVKIFL